MIFRQDESKLDCSTMKDNEASEGSQRHIFQLLKCVGLAVCVGVVSPLSVGILFNVIFSISGKLAKDDVLSRSIALSDIETVFSLANVISNKLGTF